MFCQSIETQEDGSVALVFCYLLNGTQVQLWEEGVERPVPLRGQ